MAMSAVCQLKLKLSLALLAVAFAGSNDWDEVAHSYSDKFYHGPANGEFGHYLPGHYFQHGSDFSKFADHFSQDRLDEAKRDAKKFSRDTVDQAKGEGRWFPQHDMDHAAEGVPKKAKGSDKPSADAPVALAAAPVEEQCTSRGAMACFHDLYDEQARTTPSAPAVVCHRPPSERAALTYQQVRERSLVLTAGLAAALTAHGRRQAVSAAARDGGAHTLLGIYVARTHEDFLPLLLAASRLGATFVCMSTDLREKDLENTRNIHIIRELQPTLVIAQSPEMGKTLEGLVPDFSHVEMLQSIVAASPAEACQPDATRVPAPLCFLFTGGTRRGRCVVVTHSMVAHERSNYSQCARLSPPVRVLANTSVYWGASALGQLSIALAYGGCAILCEAQETDELRAAIAAEGADVLGLVPDQLRALAVNPPSELPDVRLVFTWGEALPAAVAERWRGHAKARLRELLISTEYWLALYRAPLEDAAGSKQYKVVRGAKLLVVSEDGEPVGEGGVGELLLSGPMVTPGYLSISQKPGDTKMAEGSDVFLDVAGHRYIRTKDLVRVVPSGLVEFQGRADMMTKVKGQWVDLLALEEALGSAQGVCEAALLPDPRGGAEPHAFLALEPGASAAELLREARSKLPRSAQVHVVHRLPRRPVTQKVDLTALERLAAPGDAGTWPLAPGMPAAPEVWTRARRKLFRHSLWTLTAACMACLWDSQAFLRLFWGSRLGKRGFELSPRVTGLGFILFPYLHYAAIVRVDQWSLVNQIFTELPLGMWGAFLLSLALPNFPLTKSSGSWIRWVRRLSGLATASWSLHGAGSAWWAGRLLSYPIVFWLGIGHRLEYDCSRWLAWRTWRGFFKWHLDRLLVWAPGFLKLEDAAAPDSEEAGRAPTSDAVAAATPETQQAEQAREDPGGGAAPPLSCKSCDRLVQLEWPPAIQEAPAAVAAVNAVVGGAFDGEGATCCWQCWLGRTNRAVQEAQVIAEASLLPAQGRAEELVTHGATAAQSASREGPAEAGVPSATQEQQLQQPPSVAQHAEGEATQQLPDGDAAAGTLSDEEQKTATQQWTPAEVAQWQQRYEQWWWYHKTEDVIDVPRKEAERLNTLGQSPPASQPGQQPESQAPAATDPQFHRLCRCLALVEGGDAAAITPSSPLHGLDSLHVALLAARVRAEFGLVALSVSAVRRAATVAELLETVEGLQKQVVAGDGKRPPAQEVATPRSAPDRAEYKISYSPGQHVPMGAWVLRADHPVRAELLQEAVGKLVDRHVALRARPLESMRVLSYFLDTGILYSLAARSIERLPWPLSLLRRLFSWALFEAWPRVGVQPRDEVYADHKSKVPFTVSVVRSQEELNSLVRKMRNRMGTTHEPLATSLVRMETDLEGLWVCGRRGGEGEVALIRAPSPEDDKLMIVEKDHGQAGVLVGPGDERWRPPPYGFPALFCAHLRPGKGVVWLRLGRPGEISLLWKPEDNPDVRWRKRMAFRMPGAQRPKHHLNFLVVMAMHNIADGHSYEPIVGDLAALYASLLPPTSKDAGLRVQPPAPLLGNSLLELQTRLESAMRAADPRASPQQLSLRGSMWKFNGRGYGHLVGLQRGAVSCLRHVGRLYGAPLDALLLALTAASIARANSEDLVPLTLYVPLRDEPGESGLVGLFADWRELMVHTDRATATILGVVLDVAQALRLRRWGVFNALRKPEATFVNFQPLDAALRGSRAGFTQIGEELWRIRESIGREELRSNKMEWVPQTLSVTIEQQDAEAWWLLLSCDAKNHPPAWMRRFVKAFEDGFWALLMDPTQKVHADFPEGFSLPA